MTNLQTGPWIRPLREFFLGRFENQIRPRAVAKHKRQSIQGESAIKGEVSAMEAPTKKFHLDNTASAIVTKHRSLVDGSLPVGTQTAHVLCASKLRAIQTTIPGVRNVVLNAPEAVIPKKLCEDRTHNKRSFEKISLAQHRNRLYLLMRDF